jgi:hypothetical protein
MISYQNGHIRYPKDYINPFMRRLLRRDYDVQLVNGELVFSVVPYGCQTRYRMTLEDIHKHLHMAQADPLLEHFTRDCAAILAKLQAEVPRQEPKLPEGITLDMLPADCPGWGNYTHELMTCGLCPVNLQCMCVGDPIV